MTEEERLEILKWAHTFIPKPGVFNNSRKLTYYGPNRGDINFSIPDNDLSIPPIIFEIKKRIEKTEGLKNFDHDSHFGDFLSFVFKDGFIHKHKDPNYDEKKLFHLRFNVFIYIPKKGGTTYYCGNVVDTIEGSYVLCRSGIDYHWTDVNEDDNPRIALSFGYAVPGWKANDLCADPKVGTYKNLFPLFDTFFL
jgi:hypothetical protein